MSKNVKIIASVVCLALAAGILYFTTFSSDGSVSGEEAQIWLKCSNPDCNQSYSLKSDEFSKALGNNPAMLMMMPGQQPQALKCIKCGQQTAYMAQQCEKCKEVFMTPMQTPGQADQDVPDRCPKCGYSAIEESQKQQK